MPSRRRALQKTDLSRKSKERNRALISPPALDAVLNGTSAILVTVGYVMIRTKRILAHKACMLAATATSAAFLISYVIYHYHLYASGEGPVHFPGAGAPRYAYLTMLTTHTILAIVIVPLVIISLVRALRSNFPAHKRIARWTLPLWAYVSVTGVLIYVVLYQIYTPAHP
jgi:putative membrane protein